MIDEAILPFATQVTQLQVTIRCIIQMALLSHYGYKIAKQQHSFAHVGGKVIEFSMRDHLLNRELMDFHAEI